jgi:hypothetical protein
MIVVAPVKFVTQLVQHPDPQTHGPSDMLPCVAMPVPWIVTVVPNSPKEGETLVIVGVQNAALHDQRHKRMSIVIRFIVMLAPDRPQKCKAWPDRQYESTQISCRLFKICS